jgi:DNA-binding NarL/FixJ family response regulator
MIRITIIMQQEQDLGRVRAAIDSRQDLAVIGTGTDSYDAIRLAEDERPDIMVIDHQLDYNGPDIVPLIKRRFPNASIILVSPYEDEKYALAALNQGVSGYLLRRFDMDILVGVIYIVHAGEYYISQRVMARLFRTPLKLQGPEKFPQIFGPGETALQHSMDFSALNRTELRILECIGQSKSTKEISETLHLKMGTVRNYISVLMRKSGIHSRLQMVNLVQGQGHHQIKAGAVPKIFYPIPISGPVRKLPPLLEASLNSEG